MNENLGSDDYVPEVYTDYRIPRQGKRYGNAEYRNLDYENEFNRFEGFPNYDNIVLNEEEYGHKIRPKERQPSPR